MATRWNSTYYMLERLVEQKKAINMFFTDESEAELDELTSNEWRLMDCLLSILQPAESATRVLSGDKYCSASLVIPIVTAMVVNIKMVQVSDEHLRKLRDDLYNSIKSRFSDVEDSDVYTISKILDPRTKDTCFISSVKTKGS